MDTQRIVDQAQSLIDLAKLIEENDYAKWRGLRARILDFLIQNSGKNSTFINQFKGFPSRTEHAANYAIEILKAFISHVETGFSSGLTIKRQAELDVVSDLLEQAGGLLKSKKIHPAAPTILIGATLEEFLRNWVEEKGLSLANKKPSLDTYSSLLRSEELITKQDVKDIVSWGGIRNHAAHGEWDELGGRDRIKIMLEGVNLFMRKYGADEI